MGRRFNWLWVTLCALVILLISSSMTYEEQTLVPTLDGLLPKDSPFAWINDIDFSYAGYHVSLEALGMAKFTEFFMRKFAHFGIFLIIGFATKLGLRSFVTPSWLASVLTLLSSTGVAAFDEFHQLLTGDRTPLFQDVMLDTAGALTGIVLALAVMGVEHWRRQRQAASRN